MAVEDVRDYDKLCRADLVLEFDDELRGFVRVIKCRDKMPTRRIPGPHEIAEIQTMSPDLWPILRDLADDAGRRASKLSHLFLGPHVTCERKR